MGLWRIRAPAYRPAVITPDLRQLRYVVEVARQRSFTRAAARLHIAQQALSQQVRVVEDGVGVVLFERTNRGAEPTAAGLVFVKEAERAIAAAERVVSRTRAAARGETGTVRLGYTVTSAYETAPLDTPARRAMSLMVTRSGRTRRNLLNRFGSVKPGTGDRGAFVEQCQQYVGAALVADAGRSGRKPHARNLGHVGDGFRGERGDVGSHQCRRRGYCHPGRLPQARLRRAMAREPGPMQPGFLPFKSSAGRCGSRIAPSAPPG